MYIVTVLSNNPKQNQQKNCLYYYILQRKFKLKLMEKQNLHLVYAYNLYNVYTMYMDTYAVLM